MNHTDFIGLSRQAQTKAFQIRLGQSSEEYILIISRLKPIDFLYKKNLEAVHFQD